MNKSIALSALCGCLLLTACQFKNEEIRIVKSPSDDRAYEYRQLDNGLNVLLISDPAIKVAAVSLDVKTGSKDDPSHREGLAHFVEHMLFLGTDKYPSADEYQKYLAANAGSHNAYTSFDNTNYFFDIKAEKLEPALDRFSRFFIKPLLQEEYVEREKNAVHSEYKAYIKSDGRRYLDVLKAVTNPSHPFSKFTVGNLNTLAEQEGESLRDAAVKFYQHYYSANQMSLVVLGKEPVNELGDWVQSKFSAVPNTHLLVDEITTPLFEVGHLPLKVEVVPVKEVRSLNISFPIANPREHLSAQPLHLIGDVLGHEGEGSLYQYLKAKGWAEGLSAGLGIEYNGGGIFGVKVSLTKEGLQHTDEINRAIFHTISLLQKTGIGEARFSEQQKINQLDFEYLEQVSAIRYVMALSSRMRLYEPSRVLQGPYLLEIYEPDLISSFLQMMTPENALLTITAPSVKTDKLSPYYDTPYKAMSISEKEISVWKAGINTKEIYFPQPNQFVPSDFFVIEPGSKTEPVKIKSSKSMDLWYANSSFAVPRGAVYLQLNSPVVNSSPNNSALSQLLLALLNDSLNRKAYPAMLVGFSQSVSSGRRGIQFYTAGYNDKQQELFELILQQLAAVDYSQQRFDKLKSQLLKQWRNSEINSPSQVLMKKLNESLYVNGWSDEELMLAAENIQLKQVVEFSQQLVSQAKRTMLVYGNFSATDVAIMADKVGFILGEVIDVETTSVDVITLAQGSRQALSHSVAHADTAVVHYVQSPAQGYKERAKMGITSQVLKPAYFNSLRTEQQFGYIVHANVSVVQRIGGMVFIVQSPVKTVEQIEAATRDFFQQSLAVVESMTEEQYGQHQQSLISALSKPVQNLREEADDYWYQLMQGYTHFERDEKLIAAIEGLDIKQWQQFYRDYFIAGLERSLLLYSPGKNLEGAKNIDTAYAPIKDIKEFKRKAKITSFN